MSEPFATALCPLPLGESDRILLAHGQGARLARRLVREVLVPALDNEYLRPLEDGALLPGVDGRVVMTTDSVVVSPLVFPGGDIGSLAVHGTVNDLAVCGAEPLYLSLALIVEEGLRLTILQTVVDSIARAARACGVSIVTGDTKVVPRGAADGLFVNMTGIGRRRAGADLGVHRVQAGDRILVSGTVGEHGAAVLAARDDIGLGDALASDTAPLHHLVAALLDARIDVRLLRNVTRGGVAAVLHEVAEAAGFTAVVEDSSVPISGAVRLACGRFGLDPLHVASGGKLVAVVAPADAPRALDTLRAHPLGRRADVIGEVGPASGHAVLVRGPRGTLRVLDEPKGPPLPRIC
jgi:hydrogenase expression/formation protein HypE